MSKLPVGPDGWSDRQVLDEILAITKDTNARIRILQQAPAPGEKKRPPPVCRKCGVELMWPKPYVRGSHAPPVNPDGTEHVCGGNPQ